MIINNKYLNSKPTYNIPEGVDVVLYVVSDKMKRGLSFNNHNLSIGCKYPYNVSVSKHPTHLQVLVRSGDNKLLSYLKEYNYLKYRGKDVVGRSGDICTNDVKKIISEYYKVLDSCKEGVKIKDK